MPRKKKQETTSLSVGTGSQPFSTTRYFYDNPAAVRYAIEMLRSLGHGLPLTIIIEPGESGDSYVSTVTGMSSDDIQTLISCRERPITFDKTQAT